LVRHHDYTLAVAEAFSGKKFANFWLHGAHLSVNGQKMSKSRGNVYYLDDLAARGYRSDHVRLFMIYAHYRKKLNFTWQNLDAVSRKLDQFKNIIGSLRKTKPGASSKGADKLVAQISLVFERNMNSDLDVKSAFNEVLEITEKLSQMNMNGCLSAEDSVAALNALERIDTVLQVIF